MFHVGRGMNKSFRLEWMENPSIGGQKRKHGFQVDR